jgi:glutathione S-transferase
MKLYGHPGSAETRRVLLTLAEKGQAAQLVFVDIASGEHKSREHLERHPFGMVPVLEDDGFEVYESRAIVRYLDQRFPEPSLTPRDIRARARMEQWISVEQSYLAPLCWPLVYQKLVLPHFGGEADPLVVSSTKRELLTVLDVMDRALRETPFLVGPSLTLADLSFMPCIEQLVITGEDDVVRARPGLARWWQSVAQRPSWPAQISIGSPPELLDARSAA